MHLGHGHLVIFLPKGYVAGRCLDGCSVTGQISRWTSPSVALFTNFLADFIARVSLCACFGLWLCGRFEMILTRACRSIPLRSFRPAAGGDGAYSFSLSAVLSASLLTLIQSVDQS